MTHPRLVQQEFASYALSLLKGAGDIPVAAELAANHQHEFPRAARILKAAVPAGTTSDPNWANKLTEYQQVAAGFIESLRSVSAFDTLLPFSRQLPLRARLAVFTANVGGKVAEGAAKPIRKLTLAGDYVDPVKCAALVVATEELLRMSHLAGVHLLQAELAAAVADSINEDFLTFLATGAPSSASTGSVLDDLNAALSVINPVGRVKPFAICSPQVAVDLATARTSQDEPRYPGFTPNGGVIAGTQFLVSTQVPGNSPDSDLVVANAPDLGLAADLPLLRSSRYATIEMQDDADGDAAQQVSMFQTNSVALLAERFVGYQKLRPTAAYVVTGASYGTSSP